MAQFKTVTQLAVEFGKERNTLKQFLWQKRKAIQPDKMALDDKGRWAAHYAPKTVKRIKALLEGPKK